MRKCKKNYYDNLLENNKNNIKGTWDILNKLIRNKQKDIKYIDRFIDNGNVIEDKTGVAEGFNDFL